MLKTNLQYVKEDKVVYAQIASDATLEEYQLQEIEAENPLLNVTQEKLDAIEDADEKQAMESVLSDLYDNIWDSSETPNPKMDVMTLLNNLMNNYIYASMANEKLMEACESLKENAILGSVRLDPFIRFNGEKLNFSTQTSKRIEMLVALRTYYDFSKRLEDINASEKEKAFIDYVTRGNAKIKLCDIMMNLMEIAWDSFIRENDN